MLPIVFSAERFVRSGKSTLFHIASPTRDTIANRCFDIGIRADEFWHPIDREPDEIVQHEHLTVALRPGTDADCGHLDGASDCSCHLLRNAFQHHCKRTGAGCRLGIGCELVAIALHAIAAELVHRLRSQANVTHHGNASTYNSCNHIGLAGRSLKLHRLATGFFENACTGFDCSAHAEVLQRVLGYDDAMVAELVARGVLQSGSR